MVLFSLGQFPTFCFISLEVLGIFFNLLHAMGLDNYRYLSSENIMDYACVYPNSAEGLDSSLFAGAVCVPSRQQKGPPR